MACERTCIKSERHAPERNDLLALLKIVAMVFVVYIHSGNLFGYAGLGKTPRILIPMRTLVGTANPIFFMVSAYLLFSKPFEWKNNIIKRSRSLLLPFLFWSTFYIAFEFVGHLIYPPAFGDVSSWGASDFVRAEFGTPFVVGPVYVPLWFLRDLFILNLVAPAFLWLLKNAPVLALAGGYIVVRAISRRTSEFDTVFPVWRVSGIA